jgi:cellulose biosynthesis protein BcsQ
MTSAPRDGKIVTFYSYKGGTGRSMALANVAWILASNGLRVLAIDWDLEAPGLHRYLHPFLDDPELTSSAGLIDYFADVTVAAREAFRAAGSGEPWWHAWTSLKRYSYSIDWEFPGAGTIDLVPAGRQGAAYAERVSSLDWTQFYDQLGGGVLLEALKRELRASYDYVLIDSRTGVSDTAGICTVQMPDELVVCFTLNQQSIKGVAAVADSAWTQRFKPNGEPGLKIWPVPTRIELAEKERLEAATAVAHATFQRYVMHLPRDERIRYWEQVQVLYQPFFAYEEILAPFVERRRSSAGSMVSSMEAIAGAITGDARVRLPVIPESRRAQVVARYTHPARPQPTGRRQVFLYHAAADKRRAGLIASALEATGIHVTTEADFNLGDSVLLSLQRQIRASAAVLYVCGPATRGTDDALEALNTALGVPSNVSLNATLIPRGMTSDKPVIPVLVDDASIDSLPTGLRDVVPADLRGARFSDGLTQLVASVDKLTRVQSVDFDPDDPEKGRWGGRAADRGRALSATVEEVVKGWYAITLEVRSTSGPLDGEVVFHVHPTFTVPVQRVPVVDGRAALELFGFGAFTCGAEVDGGRTTLELDLALDPSLPPAFRAR